MTILSVPEECELCSIPSLSESLKFPDSSCRNPLLDLRLHTCRLDLQRGPLRSVPESELEVMEAAGCPSRASAPPRMSRSWVERVLAPLEDLESLGLPALEEKCGMAFHGGLSPATPHSRLLRTFPRPGSGQLLVPVVGTVFGVLWHRKGLAGSL